MNEIVITTKRLVLKPLGPEYLESTNAYALNRENARYMCFLPYRDSEETLAKLREFETEWAKEKPEYYEFAVLYEGRHIGGVSVYFEDGAGELGWIIRKDCWGSGFAAEAAEALIDHFSEKGCTRFIAHCDTENKASCRVMEKLGMTRTAEYGGRKNRASETESFEYRYELVTAPFTSSGD